MERPQALKDRHRDSRKKIRRYIPTFQKDPPLSHKVVEFFREEKLFDVRLCLTVLTFLANV